MIPAHAINMNGEVDAVDADRFGFVKDPQLKDRDDNGVPELMVKFPGDAARDVLRTGDRRRVAITGKTVDNRLFSGVDHVRVIDRGGQGGRRRESPGPAV